MKFAADTDRGYFCRKTTVPISAPGGLDVGVFRFASIHFEPFIYQSRLRDRATITGPLVVVLEAILNFLSIQNATIVSPRIEEHGQDMGNGTYSGAMGRLQSQDAYIFLNTAVANEGRFKFIEPTDLIITNYRLLTFKPRKTVHPFNFVKVFESEVWYVLIVSVALSSLCLFLLDRWVVKGRFGTAPDSLASYVWNLCRRFFPQDPMARQDNWLHIALLFFMFAVPMQLMVILNAELTSRMTFRVEETHVKNLADVIRFKNMRIYSESRSTLSLMFTEATSGLFYQLKRQQVPVRGSFSLPPSFLLRLEEVERGQRVIVGNDDMFMNMIERLRTAKGGSCPRLQITEGSFGSLITSVFMIRTLPKSVRRTITRAIRACIESHMLHQGIGWVMRKANHCLLLVEDDAGALGIDQMLGSFTCLAIGLASAVVACFGELAHFRLVATNVRVANTQRMINVAEASEARSNANSSDDDDDITLRVGYA